MTKRLLLWSGLLLTGLLLGLGTAWVFGRVSNLIASHGAVELTLSATVDGSERFIFTRDNVWDDHGRWQPPKDVLFNGAAWLDLGQAPDDWTEFAAKLDLTKAHIVTRSGRDIVALESTAEGFDLYFADTQMGAAKYAVTISIPRK